MSTSLPVEPAAVSVFTRSRVGRRIARCVSQVLRLIPDTLLGYDVFISYGRRDGRTYADALVIALQRHGDHRFR
jgi:hypothetical protein